MIIVTGNNGEKFEYIPLGQLMTKDTVKPDKKPAILDDDGFISRMNDKIDSVQQFIKECRSDLDAHMSSMSFKTAMDDLKLYKKIVQEYN